MNKNLSQLLATALVSGLFAGSLALADNANPKANVLAPNEKPAAEKMMKGKNHCKGKHHKKMKAENGCNGKNGCGESKEKKSDAGK